MIYWGSRGAMDIEGLGERTVMQLTAKGLIEDPADIYALTAEQVATLEGFATASAEKLVAAIADSKSRPLPRLLTALGVKHLGPAASQVLAAEFGTLDRVMAASSDELAAVGRRRAGDRGLDRRLVRAPGQRGVHREAARGGRRLR